MPNSITFDDAVSGGAPSQGITFDDALSDRMGQAGQHSAPNNVVSGNRAYDLTPGPDGKLQTVPAVKPAENANFGASVKANLVDDPETKRRIIANELFPNDPNGINRVGVVDGAHVYVGDDGQLHRVSPKSVSAGAIATANAPEIAGAAIGAASGMPVAGAALGATAGKAYKKVAANLLFDEPQTSAGNAVDLAKEGALNFATGGIAKGAAMFADRGKIVDFSPSNAKAAEAVRAETKAATGIDLDLAQASGDRKLIALRAYAARFPGPSADLVQAADDASAGQFDVAVKKVLDKIGTAQPSEIAGAKGVNAAGMVIAAAKQKRNQLYAEALPPEKAKAISLSSGSRINNEQDVVKTLSSDPVIASAASKIKRSPIYQSALDGSPDSSLQFWHVVRQNIDDQIESLINSGEMGKVRVLTQARKKLTTELEAASPEFAAANKVYSEFTKNTIEPLENSAVGVLAKIKTPSTAKAAAKIFSDPNISVREIQSTKQLIDQQDPEAWNGLVRSWLGQKLNQASKVTQTGSEVNVPGKFNQAVFGTPDDRMKLLTMLPTGAVEDMKAVLSAAQKLSSTPIAGSNTMRDTEIKDQLKGTSAVLFNWITSPRQSIRNAAEQRALENGTLSITEAILDPTKRAQLKQVVKMADSTKRRAILAGALLGQGVDRAVASDADVLPQQLSR